MFLSLFRSQEQVNNSTYAHSNAVEPCTVKVRVPLRAPAANTNDLSISSVTITNTLNTSYVNTTSLSLAYSGVSGSYTDYCILENDTNVANCVWTMGNLPSVFVVNTTNEVKTLSVWIKNSSTTSARVDSNSVSLDTVIPTRPTGLALSSPASSPDFDTTPTVSMANIEAQASVQLFSDNTCSTQVGSLSNAGAGGTITITANTLTPANYTFYTTQTDLAGNQSLCSLNSVSYQLDAAIAVLTIAANSFTDTIVGANTDVTFTATNAGTGPATLASSTPRTLTTGAHYSITGGTCIASAVLPVSGTCTVIVRFTPTSSGTKTDTINLSYNDGSGNQSATRNITANALNPALLTLDQIVYDFGDTVYPHPTNTITVTVTNSGDVSATSVAINTAMVDFNYVGGTYPGTSGSCGTSLAAGANCTLKLNFRPTMDSLSTGAGRRFEEIPIEYHDGLNNTQKNLLLRGESKLLLIGSNYLNRSGDMVRASWDFGTVHKGRTHYYIATIKNPSTNTTLTNLQFNFDSTTYFNFAGGTFPGTGGPGNTPSKSSCTTSLAPGAECELILSFTPNTGYNGSGTNLMITTSTASGTMGRILLRGTMSSLDTEALCSAANAGGFPFAGGTGTSTDPYLIRTTSQFSAIDDLDSNSGWSGVHFLQCSDITINLRDSIGRDAASSFGGIYDGNFYQLNPDFSGARCLGAKCSGGIFYRLSSASGVGVIKNLHVFNVNFDESTQNISADPGFGTIAKYGGSTGRYNKAQNIIVTGTIKTKTGGAILGVGGGVSKSFSTASVQNTDEPYTKVGGLIGSGGSVSQSFSTGTIVCNQYTGVDIDRTGCGGLVGTAGAVENSFFFGTVTGQSSFFSSNVSHTIGGLVATTDSNTILPSSQSGAQSSYASGVIQSTNFGTISGSGTVGGIVGTSTTHDFALTNFGSVLASNLVNGSLAVGGIYGERQTSDSENLYNFGEVTGYEDYTYNIGDPSRGSCAAGGIAGVLSGSALTNVVSDADLHQRIGAGFGLYTCSVGGTVGLAANGSLSEVTHYGSINTVNAPAGGIAGVIDISTVAISSTASMPTQINSIGPLGAIAYDPLFYRSSGGTSMVNNGTNFYWSDQDFSASRGTVSADYSGISFTQNVSNPFNSSSTPIGAGLTGDFQLDSYWKFLPGLPEPTFVVVE